MSPLDELERGVSRQIEEAQKKGFFDNLPGKGKPLKLNENPYVDPEKDAAYRLLNDNEFTLPWIEKGQLIDRELAAARHALSLTWDMVQRSGPGETWVGVEWDRATAVFRERIGLINRLTRDYNIEIPSLRLERFILDAEAEINKIKQHGS